MVKVAMSTGTPGARRLTQGQSIAEAAHIATMNERERCAKICEAYAKRTRGARDGSGLVAFQLADEIRKTP